MPLINLTKQKDTDKYSTTKNKYDAQIEQNAQIKQNILLTVKKNVID